jgi:L-asparaginase
VACFGVGHSPELWLPMLTEDSARIPVVLTSRTAAALSWPEHTDFAAPNAMIDRGLIPGGLLDPCKARILLLLALAAGADQKQVDAAFAVAGGLANAAAWPCQATVPSPLALGGQ